MDNGRSSKWFYRRLLVLHWLLVLLGAGTLLGLHRYPSIGFVEGSIAYLNIFKAPYAYFLWLYDGERFQFLGVIIILVGIVAAKALWLFLNFFTPIVRRTWIAATISLLATQIVLWLPVLILSLVIFGGLFPGDIKI